MASEYPPAGMPVAAPAYYPAAQPYAAAQPYVPAASYPSNTPPVQVTPTAYQAAPALTNPAVYGARQAPVAQPVAPVENSLIAEPTPNLVNSMVGQDAGCDKEYSCFGYGSRPADCGTTVAEACQPVACNPWYGSVLGFYMTRDRANGVWTTHQSTNEANQLFNTRELQSEWKGGGEIRFGRRFCCDQWAVEASYWTVDPFQDSASIPRTADSTVSSPLAFNYVRFGGLAADGYFNGAQEHRLWRNDEMQNIELNLVRYRAYYDCSSPWSLNWLAGVRFFRFSDDLRFGTLQDGRSWGEGGGQYEAYLRDRATNTLIGGQIGFDAGYSLGRSVRLFLTPKIGLYNNHIDNLFQLYRGDGVAADVGASGVVGTYPVHASTNQLSMLTQIDAGLDWQFAANWSARLGYRVMAATGMGLADHQIPFYIVDVPEIASIKNNGNLLLHGAFVGVTYNF